MSENDFPAESENSPVGNSDLQAVEKMADAFGKISKELSRVIIGQDQVVEELLVAMFAGGHCLLVARWQNL